MSQLNEKQKAAFQKVVSGKNVFVGGPGGVGKSFLLRYIQEKYKDSCVVLAPTGIAALNIKGSTIHSVMKFPFSILDKRTQVGKNVEKLFDQNSPVTTIIIDEISMVRSDILFAMDHHLRKIRRNNLPFGGLKVIAFGDFYQLCPVVTNKDGRVFFDLYDSMYCFALETWSSAQFEYIELDQIMRQTDETFIGHLQNIRRGENISESLNFFNEIGTNNLDAVVEEDPVFLCTTNKSASIINDHNYYQLDEKEYIIRGEIRGRFDETLPAPEVLKLKHGTKLICTANTPTLRNGQTLYFLEKVGDNILCLEEESEAEIMLEPYTWESIDYAIGPEKTLERNVTGSYKQFPVKMGWAITVHKCQGMSLDNVVIDRDRGFFSHGQAYVALSRLRTLDGMGLMNPLKWNDIIVDKEVREFYDNGCRGIGLF